jgi:hypothetical protein
MFFLTAIKFCSLEILSAQDGKHNTAVINPNKKVYVDKAEKLRVLLCSLTHWLNI